MSLKLEKEVGAHGTVHGKLTFDAEGNDIPKSPYFSRQVHWPGGISGDRLFNIIYPGYARAAEKRYTKATADVKDATPWSDLNQAVRDVAVDFNYHYTTMGIWTSRIFVPSWAMMKSGCKITSTKRQKLSNLRKEGIVQSICKSKKGRLVRFVVQAIFLAFSFLLAPSCFAENSHANVDGFYTLPSGSCDQYAGQRRAKCQKLKPRDCLLLKHESADTIHLEVSRDQLVTVCTVRGVAHVENGRIIYKHLGLLDKEVSFELVVSDKFLTFKDVTKQRPRDPICGIHGDLDGVRFERSKKIKTAKTCYSG